MDTDTEADGDADGDGESDAGADVDGGVGADGTLVGAAFAGVEDDDREDSVGNTVEEVGLGTSVVVVFVAPGVT